LSNEAATIHLLTETVRPILKNLKPVKSTAYTITIEYPISCAGIVCKEKENFRVEVTENNNSKDYLATEFGKSLTPKPINIIRFRGDFIQIMISDLSKLDSLENIDFKALLSKHTKKVFREKLYKYDLNCKYTYSNGEFENDYVIRLKKRKPYLAIRPSVGIGAGLIKGHLVNNGTFLIETSFNDYGKGAIRLYAQYEYMANYDDNSVYGSGFLNLGANMNFSEDYEPKDWMGFGIGYLIHRQNNSIFGENTLKIFFERQLRFGLKIRPEVYIETKDPELYLGFLFSMNI
jgi:hypothetical protein